MATQTPSAPSVRKDRSAYRRDIDGLRGLAIALVVFFHVFVGKVSSGVDIFLLIGGIFFFGPQIRNALSPKGLTIVQSVIRIMRRLFPALITVAVGTLLLAALVFRPIRMPAVATDAVQSLLYKQNFHLAELNQDYAAVGRDVSIYQHIWSMSAQLQIYLGSLLVITLLALVIRKAKTFYWILGAATVASFVYAIVMHTVDQGWNYYSPFSRFWEISLGGLLGIWVVKRAIPARLSFLRIPAGLVGLALVVATGIVMDGAQQFPGPLTLVPLLGALLIILSGNPSEHSRVPRVGGVTAVLNTAPFQFLGRISYSLYLWHWPLLVLATFFFSRSDATAGRQNTAGGGMGIIATLGTGKGIVVGVGVIAVSLVLAWATLTFVETPLRQGSKPERSWVITERSYMRGAAQGAPMKVLATAVIIALFASVASYNVLIRPQDRSFEESIENVRAQQAQYPGPNELLRGEKVESADPLPPATDEVSSMFPQSDDDGCNSLFEGSDLVLIQNRNQSDVPCEYGDVNSDRTLILYGNSHAEHFLPALDKVAERRGIKVIPLFKMGCFPGGLPLRTEGQDYPECGQWQINAEQFIMETMPSEGVMIIGSQPPPGTREPETVPQGLIDLVFRFTSAGLHTWSLRDSPWPRTDKGNLDVRMCVAEGDYDPDDPEKDCGFPRELTYRDVNPAVAAFAGADVTFIDLSSSFCTEDRCPGVVGNVMVYRDSSHITNVYSAMLDEELEAQMYGTATPENPAEPTPAP